MKDIEDKKDVHGGFLRPNLVYHKLVLVPGTATDIWARDHHQVYTLLLVFPDLVPKWIFLKVIKQKLPGLGGE